MINACKGGSNAAFDIKYPLAEKSPTPAIPAINPNRIERKISLFSIIINLTTIDRFFTMLYLLVGYVPYYDILSEMLKALHVYQLPQVYHFLRIKFYQHL